MVGTYHVYSNDVVVGQVVVEKQGMFYVFHCNCHPTESGPHYLWAIWGDHQEKLGICVHRSGSIGLTTTMSKKKAGEGKCRFELRKQGIKEESIYYLDDLNEPLALLTNLPGLRLIISNGRKGITITNRPTED